jgi:hypothetical protein
VTDQNPKFDLKPFVASVPWENLGVEHAAELRRAERALDLVPGELPPYLERARVALRSGADRGAGWVRVSICRWRWICFGTLESFRGVDMRCRFVVVDDLRELQRLKEGSG